MGDNTGINWTDATWNCVTGCNKISAGCKHCYAETTALRLQAMGQPNYRNGFALTLHPHMLEKPLSWKRPRLIFVNSMSDIFHADVPELFIRQIFDVMRKAHWHRFQVLTKRSERLVEMAPRLQWPANVWMGVSVEDRRSLGRVDHLRQVSAAVRFLSCEPLLESLVPGLVLDGIHWVIVGGESGRGARTMQAPWATEIRDLCQAHGVPYFFKQWGGDRKWETGRTLEGRTWDEMPAALAQGELW